MTEQDNSINAHYGVNSKESYKKTMEIFHSIITTKSITGVIDKYFHDLNAEQKSMVHDYAVALNYATIFNDAIQKDAMKRQPNIRSIGVLQ